MSKSRLSTLFRCQTPTRWLASMQITDLRPCPQAHLYMGIYLRPSILKGGLVYEAYVDGFGLDRGHAATENPQGSQQIFVNGQHFSGTAFELDGTDNQDPILGIIVVNPNLDAIQETKINLQDYDAEFGKAVAGVVTVQTKSGSNDFHGEGFWFRRTDATAARDPFTQYAPNPITGRFIPSDKWQQFGGTIGGPIIKNKLFFFGDYQATRENNGT